MVDIVTRTDKGSALTFAEMDANLTNLKAGVEACAPSSIYAAQVLADSPVAYWRFNDEYGATTYADSSASGSYPLTAVGTYTLVPTKGGLEADSDRGMYSCGGTTGGSASISSALASAWPTSSSFTIEALVKANSSNLGAYSSIFCIGSTLSSNIAEIRLSLITNSVMAPYFSVGTSSSSSTTVVTSGTARFPLDEWFHIAATCDGSHLYLYINGSLVASYSGSFTVPIVKRAYGGVLRNQYTPAAAAADQPPSACIDEVALYNTCLSATRIAAHAKYMRGATS